MRVKRFSSALLVIIMLAAIFPIDRAAAYVDYLDGTVFSYVWSSDYSQVTALKIYYENSVNSYYRETIKKSEMVDTVVSWDNDGYATYTATFSDPEFEAQTRTIYDADDVVKKWDFETVSNSSEWILSGFVRGSSETRIGRSGSYCLRADDGENLSPQFYSYITLPENACLTFWAAGGCSPWVEHRVKVFCGENLDSMEQVFSTELKYQMDGENYDDRGVSNTSLGLDPNQYFVDLSAYSGKQVYLRFAVTIGQGYHTDHTILIDDVELRSAAPIIPINPAKFPDTTFRTYVEQFDTNNDGYLSESEIAAVDYLPVYGEGISSLQGVQHFTALKCLSCSTNQLTALDVSQNTALEVLECDNNRLTNLNVSANTVLEYLYCSQNQLSALDVSCCPGLKELHCFGNSIATLDISTCPNLMNIYLNGTYKETTSGGVTYDKYTLSGNSLCVDQATRVIVSAAPTIATQPTSQTVAVGEKATFKVVASGTGLTYQWQYSKNGTSWTDKAGASSASYTVTAKASYNGLYYRCKVSNAGGEVFSNKVKLTVTSTAKPVITTQPANKTVAAGASATFQVAASGTGLTYQWQYSKNGGTSWTNKTGATSASYTVTAKESYNGMLYRCIVTNAGGSVTSGTAKLTVTVAKPVITTQPNAQTAAVGATATYKVVASGTGLTYQWQYSNDYGATWHNKTGATSATYTVTAKASYNGMLYRCRVKNSGGTVYSSKVRLTVSGVKPKVLSQPKAATAAAGGTATFKVIAAGESMSYQWQYSTNGGTTWKNKTGATSASYTVTAKASYNGILYRCRVKNSYGTVYSESAKLTVS